jgi:hypothetical protein
MHEAGHAVAAFKLGRAFRDVSIISEGDTLGRVHIPLPRGWFRPDVEVTGRGRVFIEHRIMISLAGFEAEDAWCRTVSGRPRDWKSQLLVGADTDYRMALDLADYASSSPGESESFIEWLRQRVLTLVGPEGLVFPLVYRLADELERTPKLSWPKAKTLLVAAQSEVSDDW